MEDEPIKQLSARMQALEFLVMAIIRGHLHDLTPERAAETIAELQRRFAILTVPADAVPGADLTALMAMHSDAKSMLERILIQADPRRRE